MKFHFSAINLGCPKNFVDLEYILGLIFSRAQDHDIAFYEDPQDPAAEYVLLNTCAFLSSSREETQQTLHNLEKMQKKVIVLGCYLVWEYAAFLGTLKNIYAVVPFWRYAQIEKTIFALGKNPLSWEEMKQSLKNDGGEKAFLWKGDEVRTYLNSPYRYAYLKIAEGCDGHCTFCRIPKIRGKQNSKPIDMIVSEVANMVDNGIAEVEMIAQNTTNYGSDFASAPQLGALIEALENMPQEFRFRLFYCYPDLLTQELIIAMSKSKKMIPYFDIPFQHVSENILQRMGRFGSVEKIRTLLTLIKKHIPHAYIRTNIIVGFPGETEADVKAVCDFLQEGWFDSVALFAYHDEEDVPSFHLSDKVTDAQITARMARVDDVIRAQRRQKKRNEKGQQVMGYIMGSQWQKWLIRREIHAPEIDELDLVPVSAISQMEEDADLGSQVWYTL